METNLPINSKILKWARESAGYTIEQVAEKLKKPLTVVEDWEKGEYTPTYAQLETLAYNIYKRPLIVFFFENEPQEESLKKEFRTLPESEIEFFSPEFIKCIRTARDKQFILKELFPQGNPASKFLLRNLIVDKSYPETSAKNLRDFLGISKETQERFKSPEEAYKFYRNILAEYGVFIFQYPIDKMEARGFCLYDAEFPVIVVSSKDEIHGRIFTIFHELCHLIWKTSGITRPEDNLSFRNRESKTIEVFCNKFAADVLVPKQLLLESTSVRQKSGAKWDIKLLQQIAKEFKVSIEVILRRLLDLKLATKEEYEEYRENLPRQFVPKKTEGGPTYSVKTVSQLGPNFVNTIFSHMYEGRITQFQASEYLNVKINNLYKIEIEAFK